jgi:hypothetical protein
LIPDRIWGLKITEACNIHDWMYRVDDDNGGKDHADTTFRQNMHYLINKGIQWKWLKKLRRIRAGIYYKVVSGKIGLKYYNALKNKVTV